MPNFWYPTVNCKTPDPDCVFGKPIFLPYPNPPEISEGQPDWPKADWKAFLVCQWCEQGYDYHQDDIDWGAAPLADLWVQNHMFCAELKCDQGNCGLPIKLHIFASRSKTPKDVARILLAGSQNARCEAGHKPAPVLPDVLTLKNVALVE